MCYPVGRALSRSGSCDGAGGGFGPGAASLPAKILMADTIAWLARIIAAVTFDAEKVATAPRSRFETKVRGIGEEELERLVGSHREHLEISSRGYLKAKGWIARTETGTFAVRVERVDRINSDNRRDVPETRLLENMRERRHWSLSLTALLHCRCADRFLVCPCGFLRPMRGILPCNRRAFECHAAPWERPGCFSDGYENSHGNSNSNPPL